LRRAKCQVARAWASRHFQTRCALVPHLSFRDPCTLQKLQLPVTSVSISATPRPNGLNSLVRTVNPGAFIKTPRAVNMRQPDSRQIGFCILHSAVQEAAILQQPSIRRDCSIATIRSVQPTRLADEPTPGRALLAGGLGAWETVTEARGKMGASQISPEPGVSFRVPNSKHRVHCILP
jgi:hypothetical protein